MMGTSGSPSAVAGVLEGLAALAKVISDPKALETLRKEFAAYGDVADAKLADAAERLNTAQARLEAAEKLEAQNAVVGNELANREAQDARNVDALEVARAAFAEATAAANARAAADAEALARRESAVTDRETTVAVVIEEAVKAREIALDARATALADRENQMDKHEADFATRLGALEAREKKAQTILDRAAALTA